MKLSRICGSSNGLIFAATLLLPMAALSQQNLFVSDFNDGTVQKFTATSAGGKSTYFSDVTDPRGIAALSIDSHGDLFAVNYDDGYIFKITPGGTQSIFTYSPPSVNSLAADSLDNLYAANDSLNEIVKITPGGSQSHFATLGGADGLVYSSGSLFAGTSTNAIVKFASNGTESLYFSGLPYNPISLAFDAAGDLYEADANGNIYEVTSNSTLHPFATGLSTPEGLAFDSTGDLFVTLAGANSIDEYIGNNGILNPVPVIFTSGLASPTQLIFANPVPEASAPMLFAVGATLFSGYRWLRRRIS